MNRKRLTPLIVLLIIFGSLSLPYVYAAEVLLDSYGTGNQDDLLSLQDNHPSNSEYKSAFGQTFAMGGTDYRLSSVKFYIRKNGSPTGNASARPVSYTHLTLPTILLV